ncbi:branched-chain amino acid ABC transporter permease [Rhodococcus erythropolis]|uniref:branched-chain amino acid ABC transporter permease n=1 Tax=Rhodococcus TaxID=1827 RepID=UPI0015F4E730|nr:MULTISPECIES: branched-chain amino acid ABC transporter permease [Rhodococcus]MBY6386793.1 branched-chain amino acid ABC transporter permease [Rhodococcus erythropolis]MDI9904404.1 branched-chain amino acid ABC transporter permease [Rhodococcus sp. IEGM 1406]MDJ0402704.1 branched-chain amino acid ABC transporter permease [Rhodococcus erythropolis]MDV8010123.1 branched-chain amino acid ABC transporter permease [Rhodococcus sp. IEGM 1241]
MTATAFPSSLRAPSSRRTLIVGTLVYLIAVLGAVVFVPDAKILQLATALAYALAILGLNLVSGYAGQISLGHSAFFGIGAYTSTILVTDHGLSIIATLPVGALIGFVVGIVAGLPALRLKGHYLGLVTLSFAVVFPLLITRFGSLTGGVNGKLLHSAWVIPDGVPDFITQTSINFVVVAAVTGIGILICRNFAKYGPARTLTAIRDNETAAATSGINLSRQKTIAFAVSAAFAAVGGSMFVLVTGVVAPETFGVFLGIQLLTGLLIGGSGTLIGPLIGGLVLAFLPTYTADLIGGSGANMIYGALLVALMFLMPTGIAGGAAALYSRITKRRRPIPADHDSTRPGIAPATVPTESRGGAHV